MSIEKNTPKKEILKLSTKCKQCGKCCTIGVGFVKENETQKIADKLKITIEELKKNYLEEHNIFNKGVYKPKQEKSKTKSMVFELEENPEKVYFNELPTGPCVFLKENMCEIHDCKPLHCKVGNCNKHGEELTEWYYSNQLVDYDDPQSVREWQTRITFKPTIKGANPKEQMDEELLKKIVNYKIFTKEDLEQETQEESSSSVHKRINNSLNEQKQKKK